MSKKIEFTSLREAREFVGLTQQQLAERMGVPQSELSRLEKQIDSPLQRKPRLSFYERAAKALQAELIAPKFADMGTNNLEAKTEK